MDLHGDDLFTAEERDPAVYGTDGADVMDKSYQELHDGDRVTDLHLWQVGPGHRAAVVALVAEHPEAPAVYKRRLAGLPGLSHVTVEVERCPDHAPRSRAA